MIAVNHMCIAGLGWLGAPLAKGLQQKGCKVHGTVRSADKARLWSGAAVDVAVWAGGNAAMPFAAMLPCDALIIAIPPGGDAQYYLDSVRNLVAYAEGKQAALLLLSTTGVYPSENGIFNEEAPTLQDHRTMAEEWVMQAKVHHRYAIRLGGLVGKDRLIADIIHRSPERFAAQKACNLVHQHDVVAMLCQWFELWPTSGIYNFSCPEVCSYGAYYRKYCEIMHLLPHALKDDARLQQRVIDSRKLIEILNFKFTYRSPLHFFD